MGEYLDFGGVSTFRVLKTSGVSMSVLRLWMVFRVRATWRLVIMSLRRRGVARGGARIEEL